MEREKFPPLICASMENNTTSVRFMLACDSVDVNYDRDSRGRTAMHIASSRGNVEMLRLLQEYGGDLKTHDYIGNTLMHMCGHIEVLQFLSQHGLSATKRNMKNDTPLMLAMRFGANTEVLHLLEQLELEESGELPPENCPLFGNRKVLVCSRDSGKCVKSGWLSDSTTDLGAWRILILLVFIALLSLYITYVIIGEMPMNSQLLESIPEN